MTIGISARDASPAGSCRPDGDTCRAQSLWSYYRNVHRPHDFSCRDFQLCGDGDFLGPFYTWHTSSDELSGTQAGQNGELECVEIRGTLHHMRLPFLRTAGRGRFGFIERTNT
jgi:hypothetical protein